MLTLEVVPLPGGCYGRREGVGFPICPLFKEIHDHGRYLFETSLGHARLRQRQKISYGEEIRCVMAADANF